MTADIGSLSGFAVDLGGTKIAAARFEGGRIAERRRTPTAGAASPDELIDAIERLLSPLGHNRGDPLGIATTGMIDANGFWRATNLETLAKVRDVPLGRIVADRLGPSTILNDAAAAGLAEARCGAGRGMRDFAFLTVSTGVGGALILDGRLHQTADGVAGNLGFMSSSYASVVCGSGRHGTVESVASGRAIATAARNAGHPAQDARAIFALAADGERWADELVEISAAAIADLCADLRAALGLEAILLGGSIGLAEGYLGRVTDHLDRLPPLFRCQVGLAETAHDAPLIGALVARHEEVAA